jgi:hypothetical protein
MAMRLPFTTTNTYFTHTLPPTPCASSPFQRDRQEKILKGFPHLFIVSHIVYHIMSEEPAKRVRRSPRVQARRARARALESPTRANNDGVRTHTDYSPSSDSDEQPKVAVKDMSMEQLDVAAEMGLRRDGDDELRMAVKFSASDIAACVGLHEYGEIVDLFTKYVYQDPAVMLSDQTDFGIEFVSPAELDLQQLGKLSSRSSAKGRSLIKDSKDGKKIKTIADATTLKKSVAVFIESAQKEAKLSESEIKRLSRRLMGGVNKEFGNRNEQLALDCYRARTGRHVFACNESLSVMRFPRRESGDGELPQPLEPSSSSSSSSSSLQQEKPAVKRKRKRKLPRTLNKEADSRVPYFVIRGYVDGMAEELVPSPSSCVSETQTQTKSPADSQSQSLSGVKEEVEEFMMDDCDWEVQRIILEVKNRLYRIKSPPPFYDQIQLVIYLKLHKLIEGDLIQFVKRKDRRSTTSSSSSSSVKTDTPSSSSSSSSSSILTDNSTAAAVAAAEDTTGQTKSAIQTIVHDPTTNRTTIQSPDGCELEVAVDRVRLTALHEKGWKETILPRLYQVGIVYVGSMHVQTCMVVFWVIYMYARVFFFLITQFADVVYKFRADPRLRLQFWSAHGKMDKEGPGPVLRVILKHLPFFQGTRAVSSHMNSQ